jgi:cytoskeleton protein RodZ
MQSVGSIIRTARLQAGLSLEQVSIKTRISVKNLQAIENDHFSEFSSAFFYKSFVRQFAREVNIEYDSLLPLIQATVASMPEPIMPGQRDVVIEKAALPPIGRSRRLRWLRPVGSLVIVLAVCSALYTFWESWKPEVKHVGEQPLRSDIDRPKSDQLAPATPEDGFQVEISGIERSWLALAADGRQIFSGFLEADQTKVLRGHEVGRIRTGNAGGVSLVFNGKPIGVAGPRGQIRTVVFTKDNYQVLQPAAHVALTNHSVSLVQLLHLGRPGETPFLPL